MFADLQKQIEETKKRWEKIDSLKTELEYQISADPDRSMIAARIVLLLVEQLRPLSVIDSAKFEDELKGVLESFTGGKTNE